MDSRRWWAGLATAVLGLRVGTAVLAADEAPKPEASPETRTDAADPTKGFVTFKSGDNTMTIGAWGQFKATLDDKDHFDADTAGTGVGVEDGLSGNFSIPRLRLYMLGSVYRPWMKYKIEVELANLTTNATSNINNGRITDGYFEFAKSAGATVRIGQWKVPFGLQQLTSDTRQEFVDRSIADAKFDPARDVGVMLSGLFLGNKLGYQAGAFNGGGQNNPQDDRSFMYAVRVTYDPLGEYKLIEGAVDHPEKNILHFGVAARTGEAMKGTATAGVFQNVNNEDALGVEVAWKFRRFFAMGEYFLQKDEQANPAAGPDVNANGFHAQFGVFVQPKRQEIAVRFAQVEPDDSVSDAKQTEARIVYGYFWKGHNMKLQADAGECKYGSNFAALSGLALRNVSPGLSPANRLVPLPGQDITDKQLRAQFVLAF